MQIDIGFGDTVTPKPPIAEYPTILDHTAPRIRVYPHETVVAEKLEAIVKFGAANGRMKDFYDLILISRMFDLSGAIVVEAIRATFATAARDANWT